jgi:hypothetical protein
MRRIRRRLSSADVEAHGAAISAAIARKARRFGVVSWSFVGEPPSLRVEARSRRICRRRRSFVVRAPALRFRLRVAVAPDAALIDPNPSSFLQPERLAQRLAPGAPILVGDGEGTSSAGVAAVVTIGGAPYLVTCGHVFTSDGPNVFSYGDPDPIAVLSVTYLETTPPIDAAICELTEHGRDLLLASGEAATWSRRCRAPSPALNGAPVVFWPTSEGLDGRREPVETTVSSYRAGSHVLFGGDPSDGFIELTSCVVPGDSGSALTTADDELVGLCSGQIEQRWSMFTPLATVLDRLAADYGKVELWNPADVDQLSRV